MNTQRKIQLDRSLFYLPALLLNALARILGKLLPRDHSITDENVRVIVIAKLVGMGSLVQSTVLLASLRARYPSARILYFTLEQNAALCRRFPGVDDVVTVDDSSFARAAATVVPALLRLQRERVDLYFDLEVYSHLASVLCTLSLARNRYGFFRQSCQLKHGLYTHLLYLNVFRHLSEALAQLARLAGAEPAPRLLRAQVRPEEYAAADAYLEQEAGDEPARWVAVNANASDLMLERRWPPERFVELIERLLCAGDETLRVVLIGSPDERPYLEREIAGRLSSPARVRVSVAAGRLSLFESIALLERCEALVTNDTGPMHFAFMMGVPTVSLWGPGLPAHYGPLPDTRARVLYRGIYCSPCLYHTEPPPCRGDNQCMKRIGADEVLDSVSALLDLPRPDSLIRIECLDSAPEPGTPLGVVLRP
jgi:ADP-heptose:LPS heptosyltransferase